MHAGACISAIRGITVSADIFGYQFGWIYSRRESDTLKFSGQQNQTFHSCKEMSTPFGIHQCMYFIENYGFQVGKHFMTAVG